MMFLDPGDGSGDSLAISQPAHAWVSGQILRHWAQPLDEHLVLAAEQHDLAWIDWERAPSFDPATGRPHLFRDIGAAAHAPRWIEAVERALASWGPMAALLVSRHGSVIYTRFTDRHRAADADARAAAQYVAEQTPRQQAWARKLGLSAETLDRDTDLIAFADTLSLGLCGALHLPLELEGPAVQHGNADYRLEPAEGAAFGFTLAPWPFRGASLRIDTVARRIPGGRFAAEAEMRAWLSSAPWVAPRFTLAPASVSQPGS